MEVFKLFASIFMDTSEYENSLNEAGSKTSSFASKLKSGIGTAAKIGAAAIGAVTTATTALAAASVKGVTDLASYGDNIDKMSQKLGMTAEAYQEWDAVMQHSGTSIESMQSSMKTLASAAETGNKAFDALGLSMEDIAGMSQEELFSATITALQNVDDETQRTYLAGQLLGRGATELGALLNTSAEDTQAMKDRVHELGGVMSDEAVKAAAGFQDSLQDMKTAFSGLGRGMLSEFLPSVTTVMDGLTALFSGDTDGGIAMISEGVSNFAKNLSEAIPEMMDAGAKIVNGLLTAILENLPTLVSAGADALGQIVEGIVGNIDVLLESAAKIIDTLAENIIEAADSGDLADKIGEVVVKIVEFIIKNLPKIIEAGLKIVAAIITGIIKQIPELLKLIPDLIMAILDVFESYMNYISEIGVAIIETLWEGISGMAQWIADKLSGFFGDLAERALQWGKDMIDSFIDGIKAKIEAVKNAVSGVAQTVKNFLGFSEPKEGPLSNFHTYAPDMMKLFSDGIEDNAGLLKQTFDKALDFGTATVDFAASGAGMAAAQVSAGAFQGLSAQNTVIPITLTLDGAVLARNQYVYNAREQRLHGPALVGV